MVRVTVELVSAITGKTTHLGTAFIANDGTGEGSVGHYKAMFSKKGNERAPWRYGEVKDFPRKRLGGWDLLYRALRSAVGDRNK
jgi:hypothetical protein